MNTIEDNIADYLSRIGNRQVPSGRPVKTKEKIGPQSGKNVSIDPTCDIRGIERMFFGNNVVIQKDCWLNIAYDNPDQHYIIQIGNNSNIGRRCTISAANSIVLGTDVLLAPNVFIADTSHEYRHAGVPVMNQGITTHEDRVIIGDGTWIGTNSVIVGNVSIGRHSIIGAGSLVNRDIPDYCVAAGNPCRIRKIFDLESGTWKAITNEEDLTYHLSQRQDLLDYIMPLSDLRLIMIDGRALNTEVFHQLQSIGSHRLTIIIDASMACEKEEIQRLQESANAMGCVFSVCTDISHLKCPGSPARTQLYIDGSGIFFPCRRLSSARDALGAVHESLVEEIWNKAPILKLRKNLDYLPCSSCGNQE